MIFMTHTVAKADATEQATMFLVDISLKNKKLQIASRVSSANHEIRRRLLSSKKEVRRSSVLPQKEQNVAGATAHRFSGVAHGGQYGSVLSRALPIHDVAAEPDLRGSRKRDKEEEEHCNYFAPRFGQDHNDREAPAARRSDPAGRSCQAEGGAEADRVRLHANGAGERNINLSNGDVI